MSGEEWAQLYFDNVYVPSEMVVLKEGGFKKQIAGFNVERIGNTARSLALGRYAFEQAREWALPRLDDRRRLCRDPQEPHRRGHLREKLFAASGGSGIVLPFRICTMSI